MVHSPAFAFLNGVSGRIVDEMIAFDWTTTSQEEADRNYGRKMRKQEAKEGRERRKAAEQCRKHPDDQDACRYSGSRAGY